MGRRATDTDVYVMAPLGGFGEREAWPDGSETRIPDWSNGGCGCGGTADGRLAISVARAAAQATPSPAAITAITDAKSKTIN